MRVDQKDFREDTKARLPLIFCVQNFIVVFIIKTCGLYYKRVTIVIYDCRDCGIYYEGITIVNYASISLAKSPRVLSDTTIRSITL